MIIRLSNLTEIKLKENEFLLFNYYDGTVSIMHPNNPEIINQFDLSEILQIFPN